ncbi:hypothetical protein KP509_30G018300 [Ceratopteris richardii]|uniref:Bifunctional inhibitor/plant lipid transfer protein/seed storage helical domain-containing protein n=1 Tax=Ceratopteris richardii TaxID=49495 RepID=A0A8T2R233_CERRI|nr:hypothetical protein KP509_30G018300 [Ceratopteris richardii]
MAAMAIRNRKMPIVPSLLAVAVVMVLLPMPTSQLPPYTPPLSAAPPIPSVSLSPPPPYFPSPPPTSDGDYVPQQCSSALVSFTSCLPSLASMVGRGSAIGSPGSKPSGRCCVSLRSIDPTCFCQLLEQARQFVGSTGSVTDDITQRLTSAAHQLPGLCGLSAKFIQKQG